MEDASLRRSQTTANLSFQLISGIQNPITPHSKMHINLILGACVAGLQLVAANASEHHKNKHDKIKRVTEVRARPAFPSNWADAWGPYDGKPENHHKGSKHAHDDNNNDGKHDKHEKSKHPNLTHDSKPNKEHQQAHHSKQHKNKHHSDKPSKSEQHHPADTQGRTQGSAPPEYSYSAGGTYQQQVIYNHNVHRSNHSAPQVTWSDSLAATAGKIAAGCVFQHVIGVGNVAYGQNIAAGAPDAAISHVISDQFYNAEVNYFAGQYGDPNPTGFEHVSMPIPILVSDIC